MITPPMKDYKMKNIADSFIRVKWRDFIESEYQIETEKSQEKGQEEEG